MGTRKKGNTKGNTTTTTTEPVATFNKPEPVTPAVRKGTSTVANPVGMVWVTCINITHNNGGTVQPRKVYTRECINMGVTYYTVRTQVNRYLQWEAGGREGKLPRGVTIG